MKRFLNHYLSVTLVASLFFLAGCGEDEVDPIIDDATVVDLGFDEDEITADVGEEVEFDVNVTAPAGFNRLVIYETVGADGTRETLIDTARASGTTLETFTLPFTYTPSAEVAGEDVFLEFFVVDDEAREVTQEFIVRVNEPEVTEYQAVLLQAPTESQTNEVWFSTSTGQKYSTQAVNDTEEPISAQIDFGYRYGPTAKATLAAPAAYPTEGQQNLSGWGALNETMLRRVSSDVSETEFLEMGNTSEALETAYENATVDEEGGDTPQKLTNLQVGDVLAFMTDPEKPDNLGGRYGLIFVEAIDLGTDGTGFGSDASITLNIKVQPVTPAEE